MALTKKLRRYRGWIAVVVLVAVGGVAYTVWHNSQSKRPSTIYQTEAAAKGTLAVTVAGTGNLAIHDETDVWPTAEGTVASVKVSEGETVTAGQTLFTLDPDDAEAATQKAYATYLTAKNSVTQASVSLQRARNTLADLKERYSDQGSSAGTSSATKVTKTDIAAAEADVSSAKASLYSARINRTTALEDYQDAQDAEGDLTVKAPSDGVVYALNIEKGDTVSTKTSTSSSSSSSGSSSASGSSGSSASGTSAGGSSGTSSSSGSGSSSSSSAPIVLVDKSSLAVELTVNEVDLPSLKLKQRADITIDAYPDLSYTGKVLEIAKSGTVSSGVVTFDVWLSLDVPDSNLREGMSAAGTIVTKVVDDALLVPNGAVDSDTQGDYVMVMKSGATTPTRVDVKTGLSNDTSTQILSGLSAGDMVVTSSSDSSSSGSSSSGSSSDSSSSKGNSSRGASSLMMGGSGPSGGGPGGGF